VTLLEPLTVPTVQLSVTAMQSNTEKERLCVLVTAHPDDESLFFLPTLTALRSTGATIWVLCLTTGDYDGLGACRSRELHHACLSILGLSKVILLDEPTLFPDHSSKAWPIEATAKRIQAALEQEFQKEKGSKQWKAVDLITFDQGGVSNHVNHRDTFFAVRYLFQQQQESLLPPIGDVWTLETINNPLCKYIPVYEWTLLLLYWLGLPATAVAHSAATDREDTVRVYRMHQPVLNWKAMAAHQSQFVWYRRLFVVFSCYTYHNRLRKIPTMKSE